MLLFAEALGARTGRERGVEMLALAQIASEEGIDG